MLTRSENGRKAWINSYSRFDGRIAQLVEHLPYKEGVTGSSPVSPKEVRRYWLRWFITDAMRGD